MHLKHLQLQGYKTFATKTEFLFPSGITAIIGPNGSGKSNITDAIRWVLGEQSYITLRGKRTEDMIFSGSQSRPRAGMAEVILTLDNSDGWLPVEFSEVTISRCAYRDSQNEYRINGSRVRLRDISVLLSQSGLSRRTYTVVGQGVVDSVLTLRAQERRELFEEAAGIAHYQDKRDDALRKLDETQRNLERVHDIVTEIEPRLRRLQQQAERAREHRQLSSHLERLERIWHGYRWGQAAAALNQAQRIASQRAEQYEKRAQRLQAMTEEIEQMRQEQSNLRRQLSEWHRQSSVLHTHAQAGQRELAVLAERSRQLSAQRSEHLAEIATLEAREAAQTERVAQAQAELVAAEQALVQQENEAASAQAAFDARLGERDVLVKARNAAREEQAELRADIAQRDSRQEAIADRVETLAAQTAANRVEMGRLNEQLDTLSAQIAQVEAQLSRFRVEQKEARKTLGDLAQQRQVTTDQLNLEQATLRRLRESEAEISARFELLSQLRRDLVIYGQAVPALLTGGEASRGEPTTAVPGILGVLAQMIQIPPESPAGMVTAVEAALGTYAGAVVVANWRTAANALEYLRSAGVMGRVVFIPLEAPATQETSPLRVEPNSEESPISSQIECDDRIRPLVERLLGNAYVVSDLQSGQSQLSRLGSGAVCVTLEGEVLRSNGVIEAGKQAEHTKPLAQEKEWSQLNARRVEVGARREAAEADVARTGAALEELLQQTAQINAALDELAARRMTADTAHGKLARQEDRLQHEIDWRKTQMASDEADLQALRQRQEELTREIAEFAKAQAATDKNAQELTTKLDALRTERLSEELTAAQMALVAARQTRQGQETILHELETGLARLNEERETRRRRVAELTEEEQSATERSAQLTQAQTDVAAQLEALAAQIEPAEARLAALEEEQRRLEAHERLDQARLREFESHLSAARLEVQRREDALGQLRSRIEEDLGLVELELGPSVLGQTPLPLHPLVSKLPVVEQLPEGVEDEIKRLRAQLRRLGPINPNALGDYNEELQRYNFLQEQSSDLVEASDTLRKIIAEMDALIEHAFRQTFDAVASEFSHSFTTLFGGGQARLQLSDPDDLTQTGVEIVAQPPGRRLQPLASLSGGERALTAVALIFSILKVSPTPFCILDEVDATLDEANISRFRAMLDALTEFTQIVVITHNRGTISAADTVYGVSMGADSVSQVYSIRMEEEKIPEA